MNGSRAVRSVPGPTDNLSIESQLSSLSIQTASDHVHQATDMVEASSEGQFQNMIGQHVSKKFPDFVYDGVVESHDNVSDMFKVVYTNGYSEEMRWEDLMKNLVLHEQPLPPYTNVLANNASRDHETGEGLAQVAPTPSRKHGRTKKMSSGTKNKEVANNVCPPRQASRRPQRLARDDETLKMVLQRSTRKRGTSKMMNLRRSTRRRKELGYSYREETTDEDEDEDEPDYPLPPIIQVPWADMEDENPPEVPIRGLCTSSRKGRAKKQWVSLRISASTYHRDGQKKTSDATK